MGEAVGAPVTVCAHGVCGGTVRHEPSFVKDNRLITGGSQVKVVGANHQHLVQRIKVAHEVQSIPQV
jgi:hypothetical protein